MPTAEDFVVWRYLAKGGAYMIDGELMSEDEDFELRFGQPAAETLPEDLYLDVDTDYKPQETDLRDNLAVIGRLVVISKPLKEYLQQQEISQVEYLPVSIYGPRRKLLSKDYFILHAIDLLDCLDAKASDATWSDFLDDTIDEVRRIRLRASCVPAERQLFRMKHFPDVVLLRRDLAEAIEKQGFTGLFWEELEDYPGLRSLR